jgi:GNAT superfamily N-acetyltransferase
VNFSLRPATPADLPDIARLVRGLAEYENLIHECSATDAELGSLLFGDDPPAEAVLAEVPGRKPVGIALYYRTVNTFKGRIGLFLEDLFVEPDHRGLGIGRALLRYLGQLAIDRGYNVIEWRVLDWNEPSIQFYEKLGAVKMTDWHVRRLFGPALAALAEGASTDG